MIGAVSIGHYGSEKVSFPHGTKQQVFKSYTHAQSREHT
jgi:hypothetical protein